MSRPLFLLSPPDEFAIFAPHPDHGGPNKFSHENYAAFAADPAGFRAKAHEQWDALKAALEKHGANTLILPPDPVLLDGPFTADASLSHIRADGTHVVLMSRFSNQIRAPEVTAHMRVIAAQFPDAQFVPHDHACEGTGDNLYDMHRQCYWSGFTANPSPETAASGRSDQRAHRTLQQATGARVIGLEVKAPFYHLDTTFAPLPKGHILASREGLQDASWEMMVREAFAPHGLDAATHLIEVDKADTYAFGCNVVALGEVLIMPVISDGLRRRIETAGYQVEMVDISQFTKAGGAVHCLTNRLNGVWEV
jgi:N-dimethylarginine dimethylaminohydrolase